MKSLRTLPLLVALSACMQPADEPPVEAARDDPTAVYAAGAERAEIVGTLQLLFDALETGDVELLRRVLDPTVVMHFAEVRAGETSFGRSTVDALAERIGSAEAPLIERMWDPVVLVNGPLATIWTPYDFYAGDTFSHCGVDTANLMQTDDGWRIVGLAWTRLQPPECELHPEGPPA